MRLLLKRWKLLTTFVVILLFSFAVLRQPFVPIEQAIAITVQSITNPPSNDRIFRLLSISNRAGYDVRWHGDWVEIEGNQSFQGRLVNSKLPGQTYGPVLKAGESFVLNIGAPIYPDEPGRWRFTMSFARYNVKERWHDMAMKGQIPGWVLKRVWVDSQKLLNPTNHSRVSSDWFSNPTPPVSPK